LRPLSFAGIEKGILALAEKARTGKLGLADLSGGTFSITNGGIYGSMMSTPLLNYPQTGILGMHNIVKRAIVVGDAVVVRPMMYVALSYDHRVVDGRGRCRSWSRSRTGSSTDRMLVESDGAQSGRTTIAAPLVGSAGAGGGRRFARRGVRTPASEAAGDRGGSVISSRPSPTRRPSRPCPGVGRGENACRSRPVRATSRADRLG
jgi:hypothetical protein